MENFDGEKMGQAFGILVVSIIAAWRFIASLRKSDTEPPPERPPSIHELRGTLVDVRDKLDRTMRFMDETRDEFKDKHSEIVRQLDRIEIELRAPYKIIHRDRE